MSVRVLSEVWRASQAEKGARLVLLALADVASDDGIGWPAQSEGDRSLAAKTLLSEREIRYCLRELEERGEIEVRKAQRGRRRINVYRVVVGRIAEVEPDYDRLPFELDEPFTTGKACRSSDETRPAKPAGGRDADDRQFVPRPPAKPAGRLVRATVKEPSGRLSETDVSSSPAPAAPRAGRRDPLWDAVARSVYGTLDLSKALGRETGVATADLRAQGVEPDELPAIVKAYRQRFRDAAISASAVAKWAPVLRRSAGTSSDDRGRRAEAFVRNVGFEYDDEALREELAGFRLPENDLTGLLDLARRLRREVA